MSGFDVIGWENPVAPIECPDLDDEPAESPPRKPLCEECRNALRTNAREYIARADNCNCWRSR